jgi:uncharacterized protein
MSRPPAVPTDAIVDADVCARSGAIIERTFADADLPRLAEAGGRGGSKITARFEFSQFDALPAIDGELTGVYAATCQRCMNPVSIDLHERFQVVVVPQERPDEPGGYEPVVGDASRLDLRWLAEEQALLAAPLVPMHEATTCAEGEADAAAAHGEEEEGIRQKPFQNLRDMLGKH